MKQRYMVPVFLALTTLGIAAPGHAGDVGSGNVTSVVTLVSPPNSVVFIYTTGVRTGAPGCATIPIRFVVDASTIAGQATIATALTAYSLGKPIAITGSGNCAVWSDTESVAVLYLGS